MLPTKTRRRGPLGALMDEYERAAAELVAILDEISDEEYELVRDRETSDADCRSIQTILAHVVGSGFSYAGMLRTAWGVERIPPPRETFSRGEARGRVAAMLDYTQATLDGRWEIPEAEATALQIRSRWGPVYDLEQLLEHAIVHVLRHRRQIERFLGR
jgi:uncharacterized damage-inducible protein DinB